MKPILLFLLLSAMSVSAQNQKFKIIGECQDCPDQLVYICQMGENGEIIDTLNLIDGKFQFQKKMVNEEWFRIKYQQKPGFVELIINPTEQVEIYSKMSEKLNLSLIVGSPASIDRWHYIDRRSVMGRERTTLLKTKTLYEEQKMTVPMSLLCKIDSLTAKIEEVTFNTIIKTNSLLLKDLCLLGIESPVYFNLIKQHIDSLESSNKENYDFVNLKKTFYFRFEGNSIEQNSKIEKFLMNFELQSNIGECINKKDIGNKFLFIEFWASWCRPCRQANKKLNENSMVFQHEKLYPLFVSLDKDSIKWKEAIKQDGLEWANHAIDTFSYEKSFAKSIGISSIPTNLLVDPHGIIILQNATPEDVKAFLDKLK